ncbi:MAG: hypothetical protein KA914_11385 [Ottowia sp.]|nr:hypothetical protein [Ottowia sp.]
MDKILDGVAMGEECRQQRRLQRAGRPAHVASKKVALAANVRVVHEQGS